MALSNPFGDVLKGLLDDLFASKGVKAPTRTATAGPFKSVAQQDAASKEAELSPFMQGIKKMQGDLQKRIANPPPSHEEKQQILRSMANSMENAPVFSRPPVSRPDPDKPPQFPPAIRDPRFRPDIPTPQPGGSIQVQNAAKPDTRLAQAGPETMTDAPTGKPRQAPPELIKAVIQVESGGDPNALSEDGAIGLMQVLPSTGADAGFGLPSVTEEQLRDPVENVKFGTALLSKHLNRYNGDVQRALIAYNAGHTVADAFNGDVSSLNAETQGYLKKVAEKLGNPAIAGSTGPGTPPTAPSAVSGGQTPETPTVAPQAPSAGRAVAPARPQRPSPVKAPSLPPPPDFNLEVPTLAQGGTRRPIVPVLWQQAVAKFQESRDPKDLASVPKSGLPEILALMGRVARRSHT